MGKITTIQELMDSMPKPKTFEPKPFIHERADTLTMYFKDVPTYADRVDNFLTVHWADHDPNEMVGFTIKGVIRKLKELGGWIKFQAETPKVHVSLILKLYLAEEPATREPYQRLFDRASSLANADIDIPRSECNDPAMAI